MLLVIIGAIITGILLYIIASTFNRKENFSLDDLLNPIKSITNPILNTINTIKTTVQSLPAQISTTVTNKVNEIKGTVTSELNKIPAFAGKVKQIPGKIGSLLEGKMNDVLGLAQMEVLNPVIDFIAPKPKVDRYVLPSMPPGPAYTPEPIVNMPQIDKNQTPPLVSIEDIIDNKMESVINELDKNVNNDPVLYMILRELKFYTDTTGKRYSSDNLNNMYTQLKDMAKRSRRNIIETIIDSLINKSEFTQSEITKLQGKYIIKVPSNISSIILPLNKVFTHIILNSSSIFNSTDLLETLDADLDSIQTSGFNSILLKLTSIVERDFIGKLISKIAIDYNYHPSSDEKSGSYF